MNFFMQVLNGRRLASHCAMFWLLSASVVTERAMADDSAPHSISNHLVESHLDESHSAKSHASKNHLSFLTGTSYVPDHNQTAFTVGVDFERELSHNLGVGVVAEHALGDLDATSVFVVADLHLGRGLVVQVGPGVEFIDSRSLAVGRVGIFQELHFGEIVIAPSVSYDFTKAEDTVVFAFAVGSRF